MSDSLKKQESDKTVVLQASLEASQSYVPTTRWEKFKDSFSRVEEEDESVSDSLASLDDIEKANLATSKEQLHRKLKNKHIQMIALGGSIGTGLFIGSGGALRSGGPAALIIAWGLVGTMVFAMVHSLGELCVAFPVNGAFSTYATKFVDSSWGFAVGWNYAIMWLFVLPLELVAASMCITFWNDRINPVAWVAIFYLCIMAINLLGVKGYGEAEFYLTIVKAVALVGFIILGVVLVCGGGPTHEFIGNKNWETPGAFANGFKGVATTFVTASYSLAGTEMVGLASAEVENPRKSLPKAVRQVFWRIFLFYFLSLTFVGLLVSSKDPHLLGSSNASTSPFVIAIQNGGIYALPSIFNACILFTVVSVGNSAAYGCSRTIQSLGIQGLGPEILGYVDKKGRPLAGLAVSGFFGLLCFLSAYENQGEVFNWLLSVAGLATIFSWFNIGLCHLRFRAALKYNGRSTDELTFTAVTGIAGSIYAMIFLVVVLGIQFWVALFPIGSNGQANAKNFFQNYLGVVVIIVFYVGHKLYTRNWRIYIKLKDIDIDTGRRIIDKDILIAEMEEDRKIEQAKPMYIRIWNYWF
jgi:amino acid transporter